MPAPPNNSPPPPQAPAAAGPPSDDGGGGEVRRIRITPKFVRGVRAASRQLPSEKAAIARERKRKARGAYDTRTCRRSVWIAYRTLRSAKFPGLARNYRLERSCMSEEAHEKNRQRLRNRYKLLKAGLVKRHDGTEVHHRDGDWTNNRASNLRVIDRKDHEALHKLLLQGRRQRK